MKNNDYIKMISEIINSNAIDTERREKVLETVPRMGACIVCNMLEKNGYRRHGNGKGLTRIATHKQERGVHLCDYHAMDVDNCLLPYTYEYHGISGKPNDKHMTICFELETMRIDHIAVCELIGYGFAPTSDCTVDCEFKVPICYSLSGVTKWLGGIQWLIENGHMAIDDNCGTHIHVSYYDRVNADGLPHVAFDYRVLGQKDIYRGLFFKACEYIGSLSREKRLEYFGAGFRHYAQNPINHCTWVTDYTEYHETIFNVQHSYSLEFRLPRFKTAEQFRKNILTMQKVNSEIVAFKLHGQALTETGENILEIFKNDYPM